MQRIIFLLPEQTDHSNRHRVLLPEGDARIEQLIAKVGAEASNLGNTVIFTSHQRDAMMTGAEIFYRIGGEPALAKVLQLGDDDGQTSSDCETLEWFGTVARNWDTIFLVSHYPLLETFPGFWMKDRLAVKHTPTLQPGPAQAIYIDIQSKKAKLI